MFRFLSSYFQLELTCLWANRQRYLILSVFFQALLGLSFMGASSLTPQQFSVCGLLFLIILLAFQGETWILGSFKGSHFHNLSLMPAAFPWIIWVKLWVLAGAMILFVAINVLPWVGVGFMKREAWELLTLFIPYVIGLHTLVFVLTRGHLQGLFAGPLLLIPLEFPLILVCLSGQPLSYGKWGLGVTATTFILAWGISKIIQIQSTS